jgi:Skp family chaperone for outer membrane proteins
MKGFVSAVAMAVLLTAATAGAQTPPPPPATQKPAPAPATPAAQTPAPAPAPAPAPPKPFPEGAKIAYVVLQRIANESSEGKTSTAKIQALQQKKAAELNDKNKQLQTIQQRLEKEASVMSSTAQGDLQKQAEKLQTDIQRFTQDAQQEIQELQNQLMQAFEQRIQPILQQVGQEKGLHFIYNAPDSGIVWADPGLDVSGDVIKKLDAAAKPPAK